MDKWLFWSDRGEGKTRTMIQMANDLSKSGYKITFISGTDEKLNLLRDITHLWSDHKNDNYTLSLINERVNLGRVDFLFVDDIEITNFTVVSILNIPCHVVISASSFGSGPIKDRVPVSIIGKDNFLEIVSGEFQQTFNSNNIIKYGDIVNKYLRDKKIEQLI